MISSWREAFLLRAPAFGWPQLLQVSLSARFCSSHLLHVQRPLPAACAAAADIILELLPCASAEGDGGGGKDAESLSFSGFCRSLVARSPLGDKSASKRVWELETAGESERCPLEGLSRGCCPGTFTVVTGGRRLRVG